jgi:hypothetical protein
VLPEPREDVCVEREPVPLELVLVDRRVVVGRIVR